MEKYKLDLCKLDLTDPKEFTVYAHGFTSTVYKPVHSSRYVIKEVYLPPEEDTEKIKQRIGELEANILFSENPSLKHMVVPFQGYDICKNRLYLKFGYVPLTLDKELPNLSRKQLNQIIRSVKEVLRQIHKVRAHGDLSTSNIFLIKQKMGYKVLFGDWGADGSKPKGGDWFYFMKDLKFQLLSQDFYKKYSTDDILKIFKKDGKYDDFIEYSSRQERYLSENFSYKPKEFWERTAEKQLKYYIIQFIAKVYNNELYKK